MSRHEFRAGLEANRTTQVHQSEPIHVLCVDDELSVVELVAEFLAEEDNRFTVHTETDPDIALEHVRTETVDCLVSDYDMPGRDGLELLDAVRDVAPELPFILFTGTGSEHASLAK